MPASIKQIHKALAEDSPFTEGEKFIIKWQFNSLQLLGEFDAALIGVIARADEANLRKLALGFRREVDAFRKWSQGDLGNRIREWGLDI